MGYNLDEFDFDYFSRESREKRRNTGDNNRNSDGPGQRNVQAQENDVRDVYNNGNARASYRGQRENRSENMNVEPSRRSRNFRVNIDEKAMRDYGDSSDYYFSAREREARRNAAGGHSRSSSNRRYQTERKAGGTQTGKTIKRTINGNPGSRRTNGISEMTMKDKGCLTAVVYAVGVMVVSVILAYYMIMGMNDMFALEKPKIEVVVDVPKDATLDDIVDIIKENNIVKYPVFFRWFAQISGKTEGFKHGTYTLNTKTDYNSLLNKLRNPASSDGTIVKVMLPEGINVVQMAELLEENNVCDADAFLESVNEASFDFDFIDGIETEDSARIYRLEGYLFPDTYEFYLNDGSKNAIKKLLKTFDERITDEMMKDIKDQGKTLDEILVMASIIERESNDPEEMPKVASVFYNRLKSNDYPYLQSDATRSYPYPTPDDIPKDIKDDFVSVFDTYIVKGLPDGPICNPGLNAIKAAIYPESTGYYFFYIDEDGNHYYSKTLAEHERIASLYG